MDGKSSTSTQNDAKAAVNAAEGLLNQASKAVSPGSSGGTTGSGSGQSGSGLPPRPTSTRNASSLLSPQGSVGTLQVTPSESDMSLVSEATTGGTKKRKTIWRKVKSKASKGKNTLGRLSRSFSQNGSQMSLSSDTENASPTTESKPSISVTQAGESFQGTSAESSGDEIPAPGAPAPSPLAASGASALESPAKTSARSTGAAAPTSIGDLAKASETAAAAASKDVSAAVDSLSKAATSAPAPASTSQDQKAAAPSADLSGAAADAGKGLAGVTASAKQGASDAGASLGDAVTAASDAVEKGAADAAAAADKALGDTTEAVTNAAKEVTGAAASATGSAGATGNTTYLEVAKTLVADSPPATETSKTLENTAGAPAAPATAVTAPLASDATPETSAKSVIAKPSARAPGRPPSRMQATESTAAVAQASPAVDASKAPETSKVETDAAVPPVASASPLDKARGLMDSVAGKLTRMASGTSLGKRSTPKASDGTTSTFAETSESGAPEDGTSKAASTVDAAAKDKSRGILSGMGSTMSKLTSGGKASVVPEPEPETAPENEEPEVVPSPRQAGVPWASPQASEVGADAKLMDEVQKLVKSGALRDAYSAKDPKDLADKVESHAPQLSLSRGNVTCRVDHVMDEGHRIEMMWIQDAFGKCLGVKKFSAEDTEASMEVPVANVLATASKATVDITAYVVCDQHRTWASETLQVSAKAAARGKGMAKAFATFLLVLPLVLLLVAAGFKGYTMYQIKAAGASTKEGWKVVDVSSGITTSSKRVNESAFLGFRGEATVDVSMGNLMQVFLNTTDAPSWVKDLESVEMANAAPAHRRLCERGYKCDLYFQKYHMPWPIGNREFLLLRGLRTNRGKKTVDGAYRSVTDDRFPITNGTVRAESYWTYWHFEAVEDHQTHVVVEALVDPKGSLPAPAVNLLSRTWPKSTIQRLTERARAVPAPHKDYASW